MKSVINKIFSGNIDEEVHLEFLKFGKGIFKDKYLIDAKVQAKGVFNIKTSYEYANFLVRMCANENMIDNKPLIIKGVVVSTKNLNNELGFPIKSTKQFAGVKQAIIETEIKPTQLIVALDKLPKAFFALSFKSRNSELKIKAKAPKSAKPSPKGEKEAVPDFCSVKTTNHLIIHDLLFDIKGKKFDNASITHTLEIKKIDIPKGITDPVKIRAESTREGTIKRKIIINNSESEVFEEEKSFVA